MIALVALAAAVSAPQPGDLQTFKDWTVGCDNGRTCKAVALLPEGEFPERWLRLAVERGAATTDRVSLSLSADGVAAGRHVLTVDGRPLAEIVIGDVDGESRLTLNARQIAMLARGRTAAVEGVTASLAGISAAMRYIDDRQARANGVTAMVATGRRSAAAIPLPPALPKVMTPQAGTRPPRTITPAQAAELIGPDNAVCDYAIGPIDPEAVRLDAAHSLALVGHPCGNGAYNISSSAFIVDELGKVREATFDTDRPGENEYEGSWLVNAGFDAAGRTLTTYAKGRGLGDCGVSRSYAWDGSRFRLVEQAQMGECRGSVDYITTWRARVVAKR